MDKVLEKITELGAVIKTIQDKNTELEGKYDGLTNTEIKDLMAKGVTLSEEVDALKADAKEFKEQKAKIENLEKLASLGAGQEKNQFKEYDAGLARYLRKGELIDAEVDETMVKNYFNVKNTGMNEVELKAATKALQVQNNADGGYWVMPERLSVTVSRVFESSPMRQLCNVISTANESVDMIIDDDEADAEWVGETQIRSTTATPKPGLLSIHAHELSAKPKATQKMLDDAGFDVEGWLAGKVSNKFARKENTSFVSGDGNLKPKGLLSYAAWSGVTYEREAIQQIETAGSGVIASDDLIGIQGALIEDYQRDANWLMKRQTFFSNIITLKASGTGAYLFDPQLLKNGAGQFVLLGQPVFFGADMPAVAGSALAAVYGDFKRGYMIVDRMGLRVLRDPFTDKPFIQFYTTKRTGGAVTNYESLKIMKIKA